MTSTQGNPPNGLRQPNVIIFVSHDTGRHISPYGIDTVRTPNAERLAKEGVLFENSFCASPGCCPARSALFSGRSPHAVGMLGQTGAWAGFRFSQNATHAANYFKQLGYETMLLGVAHEIIGAGCPESHFEGIEFDAIDRTPPVTARQLETRMNALLDARRSPDQPFYLQIGTRETHTGYLADGVEPFDELGVTIPESPTLRDGPGTRAQFAALQGSVNRLDEGLGQILRVLDERGLTDNTLLVFTTDHGLPMPREKTTLYDRGIGVLLIMRYPGHYPAGKRRKDLICHMDVLPTVLEAAGAKPDPVFEGISFHQALLNGESGRRDCIFAEKTFHTSYDPVRCIRTSRYKYIFNFESVRPENYALDIFDNPVLMENRSSLAKSPDRPDELYDLEADPMETRNLAGDPAHQSIRMELARRLVKWMADTADPLLKGPVATPRFYEKLDWLKQQLSAAG